MAFVSNADSKLHLYHNQEETFYDHVFVRIVFDPGAGTTFTRRSSGTTQTVSISGAVSNSITCCDANTGRVAYTARSNVYGDIQRIANAFDWSSFHVGTH